MSKSTYPIKVEDGHVYAQVTLRDIVNSVDVRDLPMLAEYKRVYDENAKLRELVRDAWGNGHPDKSCGDCEIMDECHAEMERYGRCLFERRIEGRMRELGIEV